MRSVLKDEGGQESYDKYYNQFLGRVRDNLHVVLCFSPGDKLKQRIRKYPSMFYYCCYFMVTLLFDIHYVPMFD